MNLSHVDTKLAHRRVVALVTAFLFAAGSFVSGQDQKSSPQAQLLYNDAANFQNNGALDLAVETWQKLLKEHPEDALAGKARLYLGVCQMQLKKYELAIEAFREALGSSSDFDFADEALLNLGLCQYSLGESGKPEMYAAAASTLADLIRKSPDSRHAPQALYFQGEALYRQGKKEDSLQPYAALVQQHPKSPHRPDALYALGFTLAELDRQDDASQIYEKLLKEYPQHELANSVRMAQADALLHKGEFAVAEKKFGELASLSGFENADRAQYQQAFCAAKQREYRRAAAHYGALVTKFPNSKYREEAYIAAGRCYYQAQQWEQASRWLTAAMKDAQGHALEAAHWLCLLHIKQGEFEQAQKLAAQTIPQAEGSPFLVDLKMDQAEAMAHSPDSKQQAFKQFAAIATDHADNELAPKALYNAAFLAWEMKQFDEALRLSSKFLESYGGDRLAADARYIAADCYYHQEKHEQAASILAELLEDHTTHPDLPIWRLLYAQALFGQQEYSAAKAQALMLAEDQDSPVADAALLVAARAERQLDRVEEAKKLLARLLAEHPDSQHLDHARYRLAEYDYALKNYDAALAAYNLVLAERPDSFYAPYAAHGKGWSLLKQGQFAGAAEVFTDLINNHPDHALSAEAHFARAMCRRQTGQYRDAVEDFNVYLSSPGPLSFKVEALYERGLAETELGRHEDAVQSFASIVQEAPEDPAVDKALYELAWSYKQLGQQEKSTEMFVRLADEHPDSTAATEANFQVAESLLAANEPEKAAARYQAVLDKQSEGPLAEQAMYKLGWTDYLQDELRKAADAFERHMEAFPEGALVGEAHFMRGECLFKLKDFESALQAYGKARDRGGLSEANEVVALLHAGQSAAQLKQWEDAIDWVAAIPERFPNSPHVPEALYEQAWARQNLKQYEQALKLYNRATEATRSVIGAQARFMMGEIDFLQKNYAEAIKDFLRVMYGYGAAQAPPEFKPWQAKSGYEAGRCSEMLSQAAQNEQERAKHIANAIRYYSYVVERFPNETKLAEPAAKRLAELK